MTRKELTYKRDLSFSTWIRENLPDSVSGFMVSDIDFYIYNYKKKIHALVEVKTRNAPVKTWQKIMYENLCKWIKEGSEKDGWLFKGLYIITFENTNFEDGICYLNNNVISESELIEILSLYDLAI